MAGKASVFDFFWKASAPHLWVQDEPDSFTPIKYHPEFGFEGKTRELKKMKATKEELESGGIILPDRDFCAHKLLARNACIEYNKPFIFKCNGLQNELQMCNHKELIDDMKEYERERRLNIRERRIKGRMEYIEKMNKSG